VQTPNWLDVDRVIVLVNGKATPELTWTKETHPEKFQRDVCKFRQNVKTTLATDAHIVVITGHDTQTLGDVVGPDWGRQHPAAVSNPIFVDVDGDGFKANRDTLDAPLPVKFKAE